MYNFTPTKPDQLPRVISEINEKSYDNLIVIVNKSI
jgi:hypothetical protein